MLFAIWFDSIISPHTSIMHAQCRIIRWFSVFRIPILRNIRLAFPWMHRFPFKQNSEICDCACTHLFPIIISDHTLTPSFPLIICSTHDSAQPAQLTFDGYWWGFFLTNTHKLPNADMIKNAATIWIQAKCIAHKNYFKIVDLARANSILIHYFAYTSAAKCAEQVIITDQKNKTI